MRSDRYALSLVSAPAVEPVSCDQLKLHSRIIRDAEDTLIEDYIRAARIYCETFTRRALVTSTWRLSLDRFPVWEIILPLPPIQSVSSVTYVDEDGDTQTLSSSLYSLDIYSEPGRLTPAFDQFWPTARDQMNAVNVTFVAGYGGASAVPSSFKQAIQLLAGHWYENREAVSEVAFKEVPFAVTCLLESERWGSCPI